MPHKLGQVFLHDHNIIRKICDFSGVNAQDHVVEIGCGEGILTEALSLRAKTLHVIEIDEECVVATQTKLPTPKCPVTYTHQDFLKSGLSPVEESPVKVVANIPYYISAKIIKKLMEDRSKLISATLMVQKEFAQKLLSDPGDDGYTSLTLYTTYHFQIEKGFLVSNTCFKPVPRVDSMVIKLIPHVSPPVSVADETAFFFLIRTAFWGRRKPLRSCLKKGPYLRCKPGFEKTPFFEANPNCRGETLSLQDFALLFSQIYPFIELQNTPEATLWTE